MNIKQIRIKRWMKVCGGVIAAIALFFLLLPFGIKYYLADWLEKNGADSAIIAKLRFNPFAGRVTMGGVEVQLGGRSILHNASMVVDVGLTSLFRRDIRVEKAEYHDLAIELEQYKDGRWRFGSYTTIGEKQQATLESGEDVAFVWNFLADQVTLTNCKVHLKTPELDITLAIDEAQLDRLSTREEQPAGSFSLKGHLNKSPIELQLDTVQLVPELHIGGKISLAAFQLKVLSRLLGGVLPTLGGEVAFNGKLLYDQEANKGIQVEYDGTVGVNGPDIGNADFGTKAKSLTWQGKVHFGQAEKSPIKITTDGLLAARAFRLQVPATGLVMKGPRIDLSGKTKVTIGKNIVIDNDGSLFLQGVDLMLPPYGATESSLAWKGTVQYDSHHKQKGQWVSANGLITLGEFQVGGIDTLESFAIGGKEASWRGAVSFSRKDPGKPSVVDLNGTLAGGELLTSLVAPKLRLAQGKVELKTKASISLGEKAEVAGLSSLSLHKFTLFEGENNRPALTLDQLAITDLDGRGGKAVAVKELTAAGVKSSTAGNFPLAVAISEMRLADLVTDDLVRFTLAELQVKKPLLTAVRNNAQLVRLEELAVTKISLDRGAAESGVTVGAENVQVQNLAFLGSQDDPAKQAPVSFADATLDKIRWSRETGLQGETLHFNDLVAAVVRDKDGRIDISRQVAEMRQAGEQQSKAGEAPVAKAVTKKTVKPAAKAAPPPAATAEPRGVPFSLQKIEVAGASGISFEDHTLAVPYTTELAISKLEITALDSTRPDQKTTVLLQGEMEQQAPLQVSGDIMPFQSKPGADMKLELKNYPLSSLSGYTVQSVGTSLAGGQLQLKSGLVLADGKLNMKNAVRLKKLETKTITPKLAAELNNQLPIPLDAALPLLRDSEQNIALDVPLSGPVDKLSVGISDVLVTALGKAIVPAASGYFMYALGPYGALAYVGMKVGEKMLRVELPPVMFAQQQSTLTEDHLKYLKRIGKILHDRPETEIQLCPRVASGELMTEPEKAAIKGDVVKVDENSRDKLLALGQRRAQAVQKLLEEKYGIKRDRLLICDTKIDTRKNVVPVVLMQL